MREPLIDRLVVMSWAGGWGRALAEHVSKPFTAETGVEVEPRIHVGLKLPAPLEDALAAGAPPPFDLVWSNAVPALRAARRGHCRGLDPALVPNLAALGSRADFARDAGWAFAIPYVVHYVLTYRRGAFPARAPASYEVLLDPAHAGKIALYPGGNGFFPIAQRLGGGRVEDIPREMMPCWRYLEQLAPRVSRLGYSIGMAEDFALGRLDLAFRALTNALAFRAEGADVDFVVPREGVTDTVDALWVPKAAPEERAYWAQRYVDFALRPDVQERWCAAMGVMPARRGAPASPLFERTEGLPSTADDVGTVLHVPEALKADHEAEWESRFDAIFAQGRSGDVGPPQQVG